MNDAEQKILDELMDIQDQIGEWSAKNFGSQSYINPLLGIAEESGEFFESGKIEDMVDAAADSMIFMMDFLNRMNKQSVGTNGPKTSNFYLANILADFVAESGAWERYKEVGIFNAIPIYTGKVLRSVLKMRQCIRREENHVRALEEAIASLYYAYDRVLCYCADEHDGPSNLHEAILQTWNNIVVKRDWTPETKVDGKDDSNEDRT